MIDKIYQLKEEKNAVILAHNYQPAEIQKIADFVGDSLELCIKAKETDADIIVFCGVDFMAETAKILNPEKTVLLPEIKNTQCPMAHQLPKETILKYKERYKAPLVVYINTTAETKAYADIICTSANAPKVVESLDSDIVLFGPDKNLAYYVKKETKKEVIPIPEDGGCYVHQKFTLEDVKRAKKEHDAILLVHPECNPEIQEEADYILSTSGMVKKVLELDNKKFIIGTEIGLIDRIKLELEKKGLEKELIPLNKNAICNEMKQITLEKLYNALKEEKYKVELNREIMDKARVAIERMLNL
ncbi:quinolinate synthase NadA [Methanocaldococcus indicus]|uniref:quinolinate synthase NadA n=1 Tax=Methanocaldococcus indicus TaxID=213231 RepID=UPI003C6CF489